MERTIGNDGADTRMDDHWNVFNRNCTCIICFQSFRCNIKTQVSVEFIYMSNCCILEARVIWHSTHLALNFYHERRPSPSHKVAWQEYDAQYEGQLYATDYKYKYCTLRAFIIEFTYYQYLIIAKQPTKILVFLGSHYLVLLFLDI